MQINKRLKSLCKRSKSYLLCAVIFELVITLTIIIEQHCHYCQGNTNTYTFSWRDQNIKLAQLTAERNARKHMAWTLLTYHFDSIQVFFFQRANSSYQSQLPLKGFSSMKTGHPLSPIIITSMKQTNLRYSYIEEKQM